MRSPTVWALLKVEKVIVNIDKGSELKRVDADLMHRLHLQIIPTATGAKSAGSFLMKIEGQTKQAVILEILTPQSGQCKDRSGMLLSGETFGSRSSPWSTCKVQSPNYYYTAFRTNDINRLKW